MFLSKGRFGIKLVPLGKISEDLQEYIIELLQKNFRKKVFLARSQNIPITSYNPIRLQYNSKELIEFLLSLKSYKEKILGIINEDIYKQGSPFVFGESNVNKEVALISLWRFEQNRIFFDCDGPLMLERIKKQAIYETSTIYGLRTCADPKCVMYYCQTMDELDNKDSKYCAKCKAWI